MDHHTTDKLLDGRVILQQPRTGYRAAIDPVLLAAAAPARSGQAVLDMGCGAGAAMFCLAARVPGLRITGIELQQNYAACAVANARHNAALGEFTILQGDVIALPPDIRLGGFDHVIANPPYYDARGYDAGENAGKTAAHAMPPHGFPLWIEAAHSRLKYKGCLTIIYPAAALPDLLAALPPNFGDIRVFPLWPRHGEPAKRMIFRGIKGSKAPAQLLPGLVLHENAGYAPLVEDILRRGAPLQF